MISDVYDAVVEGFRRYGCPAAVYLGGQFFEQHTPPLRVVLKQTDDLFGPPLPSMGDTPTQQMMYGNAMNPRSVGTRRCGLDVEMWATAPRQRDPQDQYRADLAYLDALVNQFAVVLQQIASGVHVLQSGVAATGNVSANAAGLGYMLKALVDIPIIDAPWPAQQLSRCSETWAHRSGSFVITVEGKVGGEPPYQPQPPFTVPTPE